MSLGKILKWLKATLGGQSMPNLKKPEIVDIEVIVTPHATDPSKIEFSFPEKKHGKVKHWKESKDDLYHVSFENDGADGFIVLFNIEKDEGTDCRFHAVPAEAMYCHGAPTCPPPANSSWDKFIPLGVINQGRTLIVYNRNDEKRGFGFVLRFTSNRGDQVFDPIGEDMNG
jgi:hypothetical protein